MSAKPTIEKGQIIDVNIAVHIRYLVDIYFFSGSLNNLLTLERYRKHKRRSTNNKSESYHQEGRKEMEKLPVLNDIVVD